MPLIILLLAILCAMIIIYLYAKRSKQPIRTLKELTYDELQHINKILKSEYYYDTALKSYHEVEYQCFTKSHAVFSGLAIIKIYEYLKSINIKL